MNRTISYDWHLAELMARNAMHNSTDLLPHLEQRGITLSSAQIWRLVTQRPERISLQMLAALCDIFRCSPADLITTTAADESNNIRVNDAPVRELPESRHRPRRARVIRDDT
ncbi:helix-turn-helix transcriptional regulator [Gryllotalpicola koreensis]|uniref:HTH cro/C1-type domain-containing protein n=1 Tax=Gryllotalpicola koreensis TaxID=993086 RepID=A0ABP7ZXY1_9MICO